MRKAISIAFCILWMIFIFYMSGISGSDSNKTSNNLSSSIDKTYSNYVTESEVSRSTYTEQESLDMLNFLIRKNAHALEFTIMAVLVTNALFKFNYKGRRVIVYILFFCLLYGVLDEFHQSFVPERTSSVSDVLIDFLGACLGMALYYACYYGIFKKAAEK